MKRVCLLLFIAFFIAFLDLAKTTSAQSDLPRILSGRILLQVESLGEAWYINPADLERYYLGRPADAFNLMRELSIGITNANLVKIPVGLIANNNQDDDGDGLDNALETALGTDPSKADTDGDGFGDKEEVEKNYNPKGPEKLDIDPSFSSQNAGKIFLQTESKGEAWYVNPVDKKRYFLSRPADAFAIMKKLGLGITDSNLREIPRGILETSSNQPTKEDDVFYSATKAIMAGDKTLAGSYFTPEMKIMIDYTLDFLDAEGKFTLGNIMAGATLTSATDIEKIYSTSISFSGYTQILYFKIKKQPDGKWLLTNL